MRLRVNFLLLFFCLSPVATATEVLPFDDGMKLLRDRTCLGCHQVDRRRVGPSFTNIANRYGSDREIAIPMLVNSIRLGNRGKWGAIPMPAQPHVSEQEAHDLAVFILSLQQKPD
jgi:cytochrome c